MNRWFIGGALALAAMSTASGGAGVAVPADGSPVERPRIVAMAEGCKDGPTMPLNVTPPGAFFIQVQRTPSGDRMPGAAPIRPCLPGR